MTSRTQPKGTRSLRAAFLLTALAVLVGSGRGLVACSDTAGGDSGTTTPGGSTKKGSTGKGNDGTGDGKTPAPPATVVQIPTTTDGSGPGTSYDPNGAGDTGSADAPADLGANTGPAAFVVDDEGTIYLLDEINLRIAQIPANGGMGTTIPLAAAAYLDLEFDGKGGFILLASGQNGTSDDDGQTKAVIFVDGTGKETSRVTITNLDEEEEPTALVLHDDGVWVEINRSYLRKVTDASFNADTSGAQADGKFMASENSVVMAGIGDDDGVLVSKEPADGGDITDFPMVTFDSPIVAMLGTETDAQGNIYVGVEVGDPDDDSAPREAWVVSLDSSGKEQWRVQFPTPSDDVDLVRPMRVGEDGQLYVMRVSDAGKLEIQAVQP